MDFGHNSLITWTRESLEAEKENDMREKKCRVWDKEEKIWLDPEHFYITGNGLAFTCQQGRHNISCNYQLMGTERYVIEYDTGLKDKNGKKGYRDDKISFGSTRPTYLIKWSICNAGFYLESLNGRKEELGISNFTVGEIIGNIHQPEEQDNA
jgi:hypothetical protein